MKKELVKKVGKIAKKDAKFTKKFTKMLVVCGKNF